MNKKIGKKLALSKESVRQLTVNELGEAQGGYTQTCYTRLEGCVETSPYSYCLCPTKNICTLGC